MLIGQAPGYTEVVQQRPFNYTSGTRLFKWLAQAGWEESNFRAHQYMASVTRCYPGRHPSGRGDRVPSAEEIELCRPWREAELSLLPIRLIIPVGKVAISLFMEVKGPLTAIIGQKTELAGRWVVPLPHPSGASTWHMQPQHQPYLEAAIAHLRQLKAELAL
jgi:uracil-DNA glycosylase